MSGKIGCIVHGGRGPEVLEFDAVSVLVFWFGGSGSSSGGATWCRLASCNAAEVEWLWSIWTVWQFTYKYYCKPAVVGGGATYISIDVICYV